MDAKTAKEISVYDKMVERLAKEHEQWVKQNWKLRGLELAIKQIHGEGATSMEYPLEVLKKEHKGLLERNTKLGNDMYSRRDFIREYEIDMGIESERLKEIFGF